MYKPSYICVRLSEHSDITEIYSRLSPPHNFTEMCPMGDALMCLLRDGHTWGKLALIRTMQTRMNYLRISRSNFNKYDFVCVWIFEVFKKRYNLSPTSISYCRRLQILISCLLSIVTPLSKSRVGSWGIKEQLDVTLYFISLFMCSTLFGYY